ncbi:MAG: methyltransferase domain-containing protein, partial [Gemmataceae bacterium]|nr:methyltransferase domain-containing protein [Gemmataceae bacterium]
MFWKKIIRSSANNSILTKDNFLLTTKFSAITMIMVLEHVFDVEHSVKEISRVLEPKGIAIIQVPNIAFLKRRIQLLFGKFPITADTSDPSFEKSWDGQHLHNFTLGSLQTLFSRNNL